MERILELYSKHIAQTYRRQPISFSRGRGVYLWDLKGKRYVDFVGGIAVCALGHCHPSVVKSIREQAGKLLHVSNLYYIREQAELSSLLSEVCPRGIQKFFFCNSGTEAVEASLKLAIRHSKREKIIAMQGAFHGRTAASLAATWKPSFREPFAPLLPKNVEFVPFDDLGALEKVADEKTAAVILEPIQAEEGVRVPSPRFLPGVRKLCSERGILLILDEVQTGFCRTGRWFACEHWGVTPDELTMAKALGGGFPIGCLGARKEVMDSFQPGDHASTFGGNPLACEVARAVIRTMRRLDLPRKVTKTGRYFKRRLEELAEHFKIVSEVRGMGLLLGMELSSKEYAEKAVEGCLKRGYLINCTAERVLRFVPPLVVQEEHIDGLISALEEVLREMA
ncbi:MAG: aspartate aminotransferase family protein [Candidatus Hadarchaeales archaeon]